MTRSLTGVVSLAGAAVVPAPLIPVALVAVAAVLTVWLVLAATPAPAAPPLTRQARDRSIGEVERWGTPAPAGVVSPDVLLYGPPGDVFIQGVAREPCPPVSSAWQHALDRHGDAHARWGHPLPTAQELEAIDA